MTPSTIILPIAALLVALTAGITPLRLKAAEPVRPASAEAAHDAPHRPPHHAWSFTNAISITLIQQEPGSATNEVSFTITNAADVARISRSIHLEADPVGRRWDLHLHEAIFQTATGKIEVQFCNECFDVVLNSQESIQHYKMPKSFYEQVWNEIQKRAQKEHWTMQPP